MNCSSAGSVKIDWRGDVQCDQALAQRVGTDDAGLLHDARLLTRRSAPPNNHGADERAVLPNCAQLVSAAAQAREREDELAYEAAMQRLLDFFLADGVRTPAAVRRAFHLGAPSNADQENEKTVRRELAFMDRDAVDCVCDEPLDVDALDALREAEHARDLALHAQL